MIIIDGENSVLGRVASKVAKKLIEGEMVSIVNAEKILIVGNEKQIHRRYAGKFEIRDIAKPTKSPKMSRRPDLFVKRTVRGMLPSKSSRRDEAQRRLMVYIGVPKEFEGKAEKAFELKDENKKRVTVGQLCKKLGWKG